MGRADDIARKFEEANERLVQTAEKMTDQQWQTKCPDEERPVGVVVHHVASSHPTVLGLAQMIANAQPLPPITMDQLHGMNAEHAQKFADCSRAETVEFLRTNTKQGAETIRGLSDEQLDRAAPLVAFGGAEVSTQQLIEMIATGHADGHHQSVKAAIGA